MVESAVVSVIVKSDRMRKRFPRLGEMVRVVNRAGLFVVARVDREQRVADLKQRVGKVDVVDANVPFLQIRTVSKEASRAIQEFLSTGMVAGSISQRAVAGPTEVPRTTPLTNGRSEGEVDALAARREPLAS
jgi:hypothetical protein